MRPRARLGPPFYAVHLGDASLVRGVSTRCVLTLAVRRVSFCCCVLGYSGLGLKPKLKPSKLNPQTDLLGGWLGLSPKALGHIDFAL